MVTPFVTLTYFLITGTLFFLLSFLIGYPLSWVFWPSKNQVLDRIVISCSLGILLFAFISYLLLFAEFSAFRETILIFSAIQWVFLALKATKGQLSYNHHTFNIHMFTRGGLALLGLIALYVFSLVRMVMTGTLYVGSSDLQFHGLVIQKISEQNGLVTDLKPFRDVPVIYPQGIHAFASILHFLLGKPEIGLIIYPFIISTGVLMILSVFIFVRSVFHSESIALGTVFALTVLLVATDPTALFLWEVIRWGGIAQLACHSLLPSVLLAFVHPNESRRKGFFAGILAGFGAHIHVYFLVYILLLLFFYYIAMSCDCLLKRDYVTNKKHLLDFCLVLVVGVLFSLPMIIRPIILVQEHPSGVSLYNGPSSDEVGDYLQEHIRIMKCGLMFFLFNPFVWLAPLGLYLALRRTIQQGLMLLSWLVAVIAVPVSLMLFALLGYPLTFLPPNRLFALYVFPVSIMIGISIELVFTQTLRKIGEFFATFHLNRRQQQAFLFLIGILLLTGSFLLANRQNLRKLPPHVLNAIYYVGENTNDSIYILNDDAGHWIPAIAGRTCTKAFATAHGSFKYSNELNRLYEYLSEKNVNYSDVEARDMMIQLGITHIFVDPEQHFHHDETFPLSRFENESFFIELFAEKSVRFYEIISSPNDFHFFSISNSSK